MPAVPSWSSPTQFDLTNPYSGTLVFNVQSDRLYLLDQQGCEFNITVRSTKDNVPQADGSILHHRFLTGVEMVLTIQLWESQDRVACDDLLASMLDEISGSFRSLLNAGDNEGRLAWEIDGGNTRMLDDCRLLVYPEVRMTEALTIVTVTIDSKYPYAEDLTQVATLIEAGDTVTITNDGTAEYFPVFQINRLYPAAAGASPVSSFVIANNTSGQQISYDGAFPGASSISANRFAEIDCFSNTIYESTSPVGPGDGANLKAGVDELNSEYFSLLTGDNEITCDVDATVLWQPAWA